MALDEQLNLFEDGGMMDQGGTVDPVSGNDVPTGSLQEEVRDDIPAQLSEGEFVMPADVVRYHGLDKMMALRDEAKIGLAKMEAMGQMGNSEEATLPAEVPFSLEDLEVEEAPVEMAVGGFVNPYGTQFAAPTYSTQQPYGTTPFSVPTYTQQSQFASYAQQPAPPIVTQPIVQPPQQPVGGYRPVFGQQPVPGTAPTEKIRFRDIMPVTESREYRNEAGEVMLIPFVNGEPAITIPEGYTPYVPEDVTVTTPPEPTPDPSTPAAPPPSVETGSALSTEEMSLKSQRVRRTKDALGATGSRGIELSNIVTLAGFITNPIGTLLGEAKQAITGEDTPSLAERIVGERTIFERDPLTDAELTNEQRASREQAERVVGVDITGFSGNKTGDVDQVTGGVFNALGIAIDPETGFAVDTGRPEFNRNSYNNSSISKAVLDAQNLSGHTGGIPTSSVYSNYSREEKQAFADFLGQLETITGTSLSEGSTLNTVKETMGGPGLIEFGGTGEDGPTATDLARDAYLAGRARDEMIEAGVIEHTTETSGMTETAKQDPNKQEIISGLVTGTLTADDALAMGLTVSDFTSPEEAARYGIGIVPIPPTTPSAESEKITTPSGEQAEPLGPIDPGLSPEEINEYRRKYPKLFRDIPSGPQTPIPDDQNMTPIPTDPGMSVIPEGGPPPIDGSSDFLDSFKPDTEPEYDTPSGLAPVDPGLTQEEVEAVQPSRPSFSMPKISLPKPTYCCTAAWEKNKLTITEVKELRAWHNKQSQLWQDGYDSWGKWVADNLVDKSDWVASLVPHVHKAFVKKEYTFKSIAGIIIIGPGVYAAGLYKRIVKNGRIFKPNS